MRSSIGLLTCATALLSVSLLAPASLVAASTTLVAPDGAAEDGFGYQVAVDGDTVVIGASRANDSNGLETGAAYVFVRSGAAWVLQQKVFASDRTQGAGFGMGVAIEGDLLVVGAPLAMTNHDYTGAAYVFIRTGGVWRQKQKLVSGVAHNKLFGWNVSISGSTFLIGAHGENAAYVFDRAGKLPWSLQQRLAAPDPTKLDNFGWAVSLSGDTALIGASTHGTPHAGRSGAAYVFVRKSGLWLLQQELNAPDAADGDYFGHTVSLSGETALIGAYGVDVDGKEDAGAAYVFVRSPKTGAWSVQAKLMASDSEAGDHFGFVALSGDRAVVGALDRDAAGGVDSGAAYFFRRSGSTWQETAEFWAPDGAGLDSLGACTALSSAGTAVLGTYFADTPAGVDAGAAYVVEVDEAGN